MKEIAEALLRSIPVLIGVLATGVVGAGFGFWWNLQLKRRESDLATVKLFHNLYGEFFAVWKLWDCYIEDKRAFPDASHWNLLERASNAEGNMEAILVDLASKHRLSPSSLCALGQFRQLYQQLRESIRKGKPLDWRRSGHVVYEAFKESVPVIAYMIRTGRNVDGVALEQQINAWLEVTDNKHEEFWLKEKWLARKRSKRSLQRSP
jgi:hypothetical protein